MHDLKESEKRRLAEMQRKKGLQAAHPSKEAHHQASHTQRSNEADRLLQEDLQRLLGNADNAD